MLIKSLLIISLIKIAIGDQPAVDLKGPIKDTLKFGKITSCQLNLCNVKYDATKIGLNSYQSSSVKQQIQACAHGCYINVNEGSNNCKEKCKDQTLSYDGTQSEACIAGCEYQEAPVIAEKPVAQPEKPKEEAQPPQSLLTDIIDALKKEEQDSSDKSNENKADSGILEDPPMSSVLEIKPIDNDNDDSSSEEIFEPSNFFNSFMGIKGLYDKVMQNLPKALKGGSFFYSATVYDNGTVVENYQKPDDEMIINMQKEQPVKILDAILNNDLNDRRNWKGVPLAIGKPIIEPIDNHEMERPPYPLFRECKPIKFHLSTLCHDINNFFTCASMHTGLPRWFFLSLILLCSFFMLWLGIFTLSMIRRLRKHERTIVYEEDQLPLYKDIVIEEKVPPAYQAEPLPEKVKLETI